MYKVLYYKLYWLCMFVTILLATGNKLNCFISARGMLAILWHCVFVVVFCVFFVDFFHADYNHLLKKVIYSPRRAPMWQQSGTLQFCSCHGIAGFLVHELEI